MKRQLISLTCAAVLALSISTAPHAHAAATTQELSSLYGDYLAGSYAQQIQDRAAQQKYFTNAFLSQPEDIRIGRRAIVSAIEMGDMDAAVKIFQKVLKVHKTAPLARAVFGVDAFRRGRESRALKYFSGKSNDLTMTILMQLVRGWVEVEKKDYQSARETFASLEAGAYFQSYAELQLAKIDGLQGETEAALERLSAVDDDGVSGVETLLTRAQILASAGRTDEAITELEEILVENEGLSIGPVGYYLERLKAGKSLPEYSAKAEAARALTEPALGFFARNRSLDGAEVFLRFARWLDPEQTKSALWLGSILEDQGEDGQQAAYQLYLDIDELSLIHISEPTRPY